MHVEYYFSNLDDFGLNIHYCGYQKCFSDHAYGPAMREHYVIHYVKSGKGVFIVNNQTYQLSQGWSFFVFPKNVVYYKADNHEPWEYFWIGFSGSTAEKFMEYSGITSQYPILNYDEHSSVENIFKQILDNTTTQLLHNEIRCIGLIHLLFSLIIHHNKDGTEISVKSILQKKQQIVHKAVSFIDTNYSKPMQVDSIAKHVGLEKCYFSKLFKEMLGKGPHQFLTQHRIERASRLLCHTDLPIEHIAYSVGFEDPLYFSKVFKKYMKMTPSAYRQKGVYESN